jgi:predicted nucleotidyltransferase component of viral defense system
MKNALVEKTLRVIDEISTMNFVKNYYLVGGTALALQIKHRLSEDLDFMRWQKTKADKTNIDWSNIKQEISAKFTIKNIDFFANNHIELIINDDVKISFYAPEKRQPDIKPLKFLNNLILADKNSIAAMKMEVLMRRTEFRDYYDLYCILKDADNETTKSIINNALRYSGHSLKSKNLVGMLYNADLFKKNTDFERLQPKYTFAANEIAAFMREHLKNTL